MFWREFRFLWARTETHSGCSMSAHWGRVGRVLAERRKQADRLVVYKC